MKRLKISSKQETISMDLLMRLLIESFHI